MGGGACGLPFDADSEGVELAPWVAALTSVLCEGPGALDDGVGEDSVDAEEVCVDDDWLVDGDETEFTFVVVSEPLGVGEDINDDGPRFEEDVVVADVDLRLGEVVEMTVDGDSLLEDIGELVGVDEDVVLGPVDVVQDRIDETSPFENVDTVAGVDVDSASESFELVAGRVDDELVSEEERDVALVVVDCSS